MGDVAIIIGWYREHHRPLPWRETTDPYKIWVSEVILQQTRVNQGLEYYHRFLENFPDIFALAAAPEEQVLKVWQGLGYYSRARNMQHAARDIVGNHQGRFPSGYHEILRLKGVGDYIASAVASFAFGLPYPVMDGNVMRFISRFRGITEPVNTARGRHAVMEVLRREIDRDNPGLFNQAMMEFGALVCTPHRPDCSHCPLQPHCVARNTGNVDKIPVKEKKLPPRPRYFHYFYIIVKEGEQFFTVLHKRDKNDIWRNLFEFPMIEAGSLKTWDELAGGLEFDRMFPGAPPTLYGQPRDYRHVLSHQLLHVRCFTVEASDVNPEYTRIPFGNLHRYPVPKLMEKMMASINITLREEKD